MGYFSNGTEGEMYADEWCSKCIHEKHCAVWDAHFLYNYRECNKKESILDVLIPRNGIWNSKCRMFIDANDAQRPINEEPER